MPPTMQRFGGAPNNLASHYQTGYPSHSQGHNAGLPPPSHGANSFINANSLNSPFSNGNPLALAAGFTPGGGLGGLSGLHNPAGLGSHAAQMGFASASPQTHHNGLEGGGRGLHNKGRIRDVWKSNLHEEFATIRQLVDKYPYVAMDTEFPGVVARPMGLFKGKGDYHYQCIRCNVDLLKIIQLGITLFSEDGEVPNATGELENDRRRGPAEIIPHTWQFNFKFSLDEDMYSEPSIDSLKQAGLNFPGHDQNGIDPFEFGALLISSGLVCDEDVKWLSFHGGYDFAYVTKLLRRLPLPDEEKEFRADMEKFFPGIYDIKHLLKYAIKANNSGQLTPIDAQAAEVLQKFEQKSGLENLAESLKVKRQGSAHMAGSDSLLTGKVFFKIRDKIFNGEIDDAHLCQVWGLGLPETNYTGYTYAQAQLQENQTPQQNGYTNGGPSTPNTGNARPVHTPLNNSGNRGIGAMTPGGGTGVFGQFDMSGR